MSAIIAHRAMVSHKRLMAAAIAARARPQLSTWWAVAGFVVVLALAIWATGPISFLLVQQIPVEWMLAFGRFVPILVLGVLGLGGIVLVSGMYAHASKVATLREFQRRGIPLESEVEFAILPDGLRVSNGRITILYAWQTIDTIERVADGWVISADQLTSFVPANSFSSDSAQRTFVGAVLDHMIEPARNRSANARAYVAQGVAN